METQQATTANAPQRFFRVVSVLGPMLVLTLGMTLLIAGTLDQVWPVPGGGYGYNEDNAWRVRDLSEWLSTNQRGERPHIAVVIGSSSMRNAVSISSFNDAHSPDWRVMGLCGVGNVLQLSLQYLRDLEEAKIVPDHILIGLSPRNFQIESTAGLQKVLTQRGHITQNTLAGSVLRAGLPTLLSTCQKQVSLRSQSAFRKLRHAVCELSTHQHEPMSTLKISGDTGEMDFDPADRNPFREVIDARVDTRMLPTPLSPALRAVSPEQQKSLDADIRKNGTALTDSLKQWLGRGAAVTVVFLPEGSPSRNTTIEHVREPCVRFLIQELGHDPQFRIVDLLNSLPDSAFWETFHVSWSGREQSTKLLTPYVIPQAGSGFTAKPVSADEL